VTIEVVGRGHKRASDQDIASAYRSTGSVWKAAKLLGLCGQSVHERLKTLGIALSGRKWASEEDAELRSLVEEQVTVGEISQRLGRTFAAVACRMNELQIFSKAARAKKLPRGAGFDKAATLSHMKAIERSGISVRKYARAHGKNIDTLVLAFQTHCPDLWASHVSRTSDLPQKECPYCRTSFFPITALQEYCTKRCASTARIDRGYFGGNRRNTIGLAEGICQLCERHVAKGLSSHHFLGKENDSDNACLIALCQGCHKIVTMLATRAFLDDTSAWESLITLALLRRDGPKIAKGELDGKAISVCVSIGLEDAEEENDA
jgi:hypothetical protein